MGLMSLVFPRMTTARVAVAVICLFIGASAATAGGGEQLRPANLTALVGDGSSLPNSNWAGLSTRSATAAGTRAPAIDPASIPPGRNGPIDLRIDSQAAGAAATTGAKAPGIDPAILASAPNGPNYVRVEPTALAPAVDPYSVPRSANGLGPDPEKTAPRRVRLDPAGFSPDANMNGAEVVWGPVWEPTAATQESSFPTSGTTTTKFPATGDNVQVTNNPFWFHAGDYVEGVRNTASATVNAVGYELSVVNGLNSGAQIDYDLSINGSFVGSFSVFEGEVSKSLFFTFPAIAGPNYTIRLEETNTVPSGQGSIQISLDVSDLTLYDTTDSPYFPATGDVVDASNAAGYFWTTGDYAEGIRKPGLASINAVDYQLDVTSNVLNSGAQVDFDLSINGVVVGSFSVLQGELAKSLDFVFPPIAGPNYTIRLEETNTVPGGQGSVQIGLDVSELTLYVNTASPYFPATGDVIDASGGNFYYRLGDYAQGLREPGLPNVNALTYELLVNNYLNSGAQADFDLVVNGVVVGSFTVFQGEAAKSLHFTFPPIAGPMYTVRLEETNTVPSGLGSIEITLDVSELTFYDNAGGPYFPATGDVVNSSNSLDAYFWTTGDYTEGTRAPGLASVNALSYELMVTANILSVGAQVDFDLVINGTVVGSFTVFDGETSKSLQYVFPPITGPVYTVRLEETNTVPGGLGSVQIGLDVSELTFYDNATSHYFPATGDAIDVAGNPWWWQLGDQAEGTRTPGLPSVNAATYKFKTNANVLNTTGHVDLDLSINGTVVGSFVVDVAEVQESHTFTFPPIAGPVYTIRLITTNTVDPGYGSIRVPVEFSELYLYDNAPIAVGDGEGPLQTGLHAAAPNPFTEQMRIDFDLATGGNVGLYVFDAVGRRVATLAQGQYDAGRHVAVWNGHDESGANARAGTYFVKLVTPDATKTRKIVHLD